MRLITTHLSGEESAMNDQLLVEAITLPDTSVAPTTYRVWPKQLDTFPAEQNPVLASRLTRAACCIRFQVGPASDDGINGITNEALLAIVRDRLECFQNSQFACDENQVALDAVIAAMNSLHARTRKRATRGVEGTLNP